MKDLVNKLISNAHVLILIYGLYGLYTAWEEHTLKQEELNAQIVQIDNDVVQNQKRLKEIQEFVKKADEYKVRVEEVAKNIESVQKQLPADINDSQIISFFQNEINGLNIKDASITPGRSETSTYFISKEYKLQGKGTFLQFLIFFERIGNADRIYNIKNLKLSKGNESQKGRFQMVTGEGVIQAFRYNPDFRVDRGF